MGARLRSWWQKTRKPIEVIGLIAVLVMAIVLIFVEVRVFGTGFKGKTLWDWLQLLIIPAVLAIGGYLFTFTISRNERKAADRHNQTEREIAQDNQRETALQEYFDKMSELLLHEKLRESQPENEVRTIARVRTLTVLPRLDGRRKGSVLQFLYESKLIDQDKSIISTEGANLRGANLFRFDLTGANLYKADLFGADLTGCILTKANLIETDLREANFSGSDLSGASLYQAKLIGANLIRTNLIRANLNGAKLSRVNFFGAILVETNLGRADISQADLTGTQLGGADLTGADLSKAILREANLIMTILKDADLTGADLLGAKVDQKRLDQTKSLKGATMPDGSIHP